MQRCAIGPKVHRQTRRGTRTRYQEEPQKLADPWHALIVEPPGLPRAGANPLLKSLVN